MTSIYSTLTKAVCVDASRGAIPAKGCLQLLRCSFAAVVLLSLGGCVGPATDTEGRTASPSSRVTSAEPRAEEPYAEEPYAEETYVEEPYAEEPYAEEPYAEETFAEETYVEEPLAETAEVIVNSPEELLGMTDQDPALADYVFSNNCYIDQGGAMGWTCPDLGVTILMNFDSQVTKVTLGSDYQGEIIGGVMMGESQEVVIQKLGEPADVVGDNDLLWWLLEDVTMTVEFPGVIEEGYLGRAVPEQVQGVSYSLVQ